MLGINKSRWLLWRTAISVGLGAFTTLAAVALSVFLGPPTGFQCGLGSPPAFAVQRGYALLTEVRSSRLLTGTSASLLELPHRAGSKPNTIQVPETDEEKLTDEDIQAFTAGHDSFAPASPQMLDLTLQASASQETLPRYRVLQYQVLDESPFLTDMFAGSSQPNTVYEFKCGYPYRAMWTGESATYWNSGSFGQGILHTPTKWVSADFLGTRNGKPRMQGFAYEYGFPTGLLPLGFAANTTIYATAWFALLAVPGFIRRRIAKRRNLCSNCGYDLSGLGIRDTCPECGTRAELLAR